MPFEITANQNEILYDSLNKPLLGEIVDTQLLQDKVVSTIRMFRTGVVNENGRAYSKKSGKAVVGALQAEIDSGLISEVANDHSQGLYNKKGELEDFSRREKPKVADLVEAYFNDLNPDTEEGEGIAKIIWNEKTLEGQDLAKLAQDEDKRKDIKFSIKAIKGKCSRKNGILICDIAALRGVDKVDDPALDDAEVLHTEVITDSNLNLNLNSNNPNNPNNPNNFNEIKDSTSVSASSCGLDCPCEQCSLGLSINNTTLLQGDTKMFDAERIKKLHQSVTDPPLTWSQAKAIIIGDGWYYNTADCEMAEAYWKELDKERTEKANVDIPTDTANANASANATNQDTSTVKDASETTSEEGKQEPAKTAGTTKEVKDSEVSEETLKKFLEKKMSWDDVKEILATMPDVDIAVAEAKWKELEKNKETIDKENAAMNKEKGDQAVTDNRQTTNNRTPQVPNPAREAREKELDELLDARRREQADNNFNNNVEKLFEGKALTDSQKKQVRDLAKQARKENNSDQTGLYLAKHEVGRLVNFAQNQALVDARRASMGYVQGNGQILGSTVLGNEVTAPRPWQELIDKYEPLKEEIIKSANQSKIISGSDAVELRRKRKKALQDSKFFQEVVAFYEAQHCQELYDAITSSDVHGPNTARFREKLFALMVLQEQFYLTTMVDTVYQALSPTSKFNVRFPIIPCASAKPQNIGGIFVMPLKKTQEDPQAKAKHYRPARNVGKIGVVSSNLEYNRFPTRARRSAGLYDDETWQQLMQASGWDIRVENAMDNAAALARSVDDEIVIDLKNRIREYQAVNACAGGNYTPANTEWIENTGANKRYGDNITYYAVILGPHSAGTLTVSNPAGTEYPAPLIEPLPLEYIDPLTGDLIDTYIPFDCVFTVAGATNSPKLGYKDKDGNAQPYEDGDVVTHFIDAENSIVALTDESGVDGSTKPVFSEIWYATNYEIWSKSQGRLTDPFISSMPTREKAEELLNRVSDIGGELAEERNAYPTIAVHKYGFGNAYVSNARTFEKQVSPTDSELFAGHGPSMYIGKKSGITHVKTNNPIFPSSSFITQQGCGFYGLGYIYGMDREERLTVSGGTNKINAPANGTYKVYGQLDVVGHPRFSNGLNFPGYEMRIVD